VEEFHNQCQIIIHSKPSKSLSGVSQCRCDLCLRRLCTQTNKQTINSKIHNLNHATVAWPCQSLDCSADRNDLFLRILLCVYFVLFKIVITKIINEGSDFALRKEDGQVKFVNAGHHEYYQYFDLVVFDISDAKTREVLDLNRLLSSGRVLEHPTRPKPLAGWPIEVTAEKDWVIRWTKNI
jgi:hypothetical protein